MDWFGRARIRFTHSPSPLALRRKDGTKTDLAKFCEKATPVCQLNPLLQWPPPDHVDGDQGTWPANLLPEEDIRGHPQYLQGSFAVDFVVPPHDDSDEALPPRTAYFAEEEFAKIASDDNKPMLMVLHGLVLVALTRSTFAMPSNHWCVITSGKSAW